MAKTCRTCRFAHWQRKCSRQYAFANTDGYECHKPRETPLLVDELSEALGAILRALSKDWHLPAWKEAQRLYNQAEKALARHQEEVSDGGD